MMTRHGYEHSSRAKFYWNILASAQEWLLPYTMYTAQNFQGNRCFSSHAQEGWLNDFYWNFGLSNDLVECSTQLLQNICKKYEIDPMCIAQRRKIITIPLNNFSSVFQHSQCPVAGEVATCVARFCLPNSAFLLVNERRCHMCKVFSYWLSPWKKT